VSFVTLVKSVLLNAHKMRGTALIVSLMVATAPWACGQTEADSNAAAFDNFYNMDYNLATKQFRDLTVAQPQSADGWNYLAQAIFYSAMFDCGLMGSDLVKSNEAVLHSPKVVLTPEHEAEMQASLSKAEQIAQMKLKANPQDTAALYALGVSYGLQANYELLSKHAWLAGLKAADESRKLHEQVIKLDPNNYDARLVPGTHQYMVGTMPLFVRFAAKAAGVNGNRAEGLKKVELTAARGERSKLDAQILLTVLYRREGRSEAGIPILQRISETYPRNFIFRTELAKLYADTGNKAAAAAELDCVNKMIAQEAPGYTGARVAQIKVQENEVAQMIGQMPDAAPVLAAAKTQTPPHANLLK